MISIKINLKIVILSILVALIMYPKTIEILMNSGKSIYIAKKLSGVTIERNRTAAVVDKTRIVFMFDDGWKSVYTEAYGILEKYNYIGSVPIIPSRTVEKEYMSYEQLSELYLQGWDMLNHSYSHKENIYDNSDALLSDFNRARKWMKNRYIGIYSGMVVIPFGEINPFLIGQLKDAGYLSVRTSDNIIILNKSEIEYFPITTINLLTDVTVNEVKDILTKTFNEPNTIIFILHRIEDIDDGFDMTYRKDKLEEIIKFIDEHREKYQIITYSQLFQ